MKTKILITILALSLVLGGCTPKNTITLDDRDSSNSSSNPIIGNSIRDDETPPKSTDKPIASSETPSDQEHADNADTQSSYSKDLTLLNTQGIDGKIEEMFYGNNGEILLLANQLHIFNVVDNSIIATADSNFPEFREVGIYTISDGYALIGDAMQGTSGNGNGMSSTPDSGFICYIFDENLKETDKILIPEYSASIETITISPSGKDIIYYFDMTNKIEKLNISTGKTTTIQDYTNSGIGDIITIEYLAINSDNSKIIFKGQTLTSTESVSSFGTISMDGSSTVNKKFDSYKSADGAMFRANTLLLPEDSRGLTGRLLTMDVNTTDERMINLSTAKESNGRTVISDDGNYFANGEIKSNEYTIRIYSISDGTLLKTTTISDDNAEYFYRGSNITINDEERICTVSLGNWHTDIDTKLYSFGF